MRAQRLVAQMALQLLRERSSLLQHEARGDAHPASSLLCLLLRSVQLSLCFDTWRMGLALSRTWAMLEYCAQGLVALDLQHCTQVATID